MARVTTNNEWISPITCIVTSIVIEHILEPVKTESIIAPSIRGNNKVIGTLRGLILQLGIL